MPRRSNPDLPEAVLAEAERVVAASGAGALNMRRLARKLGISATAIYYYFDSKDDLLMQLKLRIAERLNARVQRIDPNLAPLSTLRALGEAYIAFAEASPRLYELLTEEIWNERPLSTAEHAVLYHAYYVARSAVERIVAGGQTPRLGAMLGWVMLHGFASLLISGRLQQAEGLDNDTLKRRFFDFYPPAPAAST